MAFYVVEHVNRKTHEIKAETFSDFDSALRCFRHKDDADNEESYLYRPDEDERISLERLRVRMAEYNSGCVTEDGFKYKYTIRENHENS